MPHAALVAAAQMDAEGHVIEQPQDLVIGLDRTHEIFQRVFAACFHLIQRWGVDISGIAGGIDLHITAACVDQAANHFPFNTLDLSLIHISEPTRLLSISYAV